MGQDKPKIILFVDNCTALLHTFTRIKLKSVTLAYYPRNTTSNPKLMDQIRITKLKVYYWKHILEY